MTFKQFLKENYKLRSVYPWVELAEEWHKQERLNVEELIKICNKIRVTHLASKKLPVLIDLMIIALDEIDNARTVVKRQKSKPALTVTELHCLWHQITKENISLSVDSFCKAIIEKLNSSGLKYRRRN